MSAPSVLQDVVQRLKRMLDSSRMPANSRLPPERELAAELGISRSTLRKALARLEAEGLIWRHVGRGTFVGGRPVAIVGLGPAGTLLASPKDVMEARLMFEPAIAAEAARNATHADIDYLWRCVNKSNAARDFETYELWDRTLHRAIAGATRNALAEMFLETVNEFRKRDDWSRQQLPSFQSRRQQESSAQHRRIVDAIASRDPRSAADIMRHHLTLVREMYFTYEADSRTDESGIAQDHQTERDSVDAR